MEDGKIIDLYWAREQSALEQTQRKYGRYLTKVAYNILASREDSEESVNDTYLAAWNTMPPHRPDCLCAFLSKLVRRISIDLLRKRETLKRGAGAYMLSLSELSECLPGGKDTEQEAEGKRLSAAVTEFVAALPEKNRRIFLGRYYFLDSVREVARYCGVTEANAKVILHRARQALRTHLEREGFL